MCQLVSNKCSLIREYRSASIDSGHNEIREGVEGSFNSGNHGDGTHPPHQAVKANSSDQTEYKYIVSSTASMNRQMDSMSGHIPFEKNVCILQHFFICIMI